MSLKRERFLDRPVLAVDFEMPDGSRLAREWTMDDPMPGWTRGRPPEWLDSPGRSWPHPQDPITLTGVVRAGHEAEARHLVLGESDYPLAP